MVDPHGTSDAPPSARPGGSDESAAPRETEAGVVEPAKVMRIGSMIRSLLEEVRQAELDEEGRDRPGTSTTRRSRSWPGPVARAAGRADAAGAAVRRRHPERGGAAVAKAQLVGWLEGLFHGIQAALFAQQMAARGSWRRCVRACRWAQDPSRPQTVLVFICRVSPVRHHRTGLRSNPETTGLFRTMAIEFKTKDCTALSDSELKEMAQISEGNPMSYGVGILSKSVTTGSRDPCLRREPAPGLCVVHARARRRHAGGARRHGLGQRSSRRDTALRDIADQLRRAVLAFPDEDVLIGTRPAPAGFEAFKALHDVVPRPGHHANGEERAWARRGAALSPEGDYDQRRSWSAARAPLRSCSTTRAPGRRRSTPTSRPCSRPRSQRRRLHDRLRMGHGRGPGEAAVGDFDRLVRRRRMTRSFSADPVDRSQVGARHRRGCRPRATRRGPTCSS